MKDSAIRNARQEGGGSASGPVPLLRMQGDSSLLMARKMFFILLFVVASGPVFGASMAEYMSARSAFNEIPFAQNSAQNPANPASMHPEKYDQSACGQGYCVSAFSLKDVQRVLAEHKPGYKLMIHYYPKSTMSRHIEKPAMIGFVLGAVAGLLVATGWMASLTMSLGVTLGVLAGFLFGAIKGSKEVKKTLNTLTEASKQNSNISYRVFKE